MSVKMSKFIATMVILLGIGMGDKAQGESDVKMSYPNGLKVEITTQAKIFTDTKILLKDGEKLGVLVTAYQKNPTGIALIKLRIIGIKPEGASLGGESVYAKGKVRLENGEEIDITNSTYQYMDQMNYKLEQLVNFMGPYVEDYLKPLGSYHAAVLSDDVIKMEMRVPENFFSISSFGAYIKPGDIISGMKGDLLKGIGVTDYQRKIAVFPENGCKMTINDEGQIVVMPKQ